MPDEVAPPDGDRLSFGALERASASYRNHERLLFVVRPVIAVATHLDEIDMGIDVDGILHYCVANIPGAVPRTSTLALTNATLPYTIQLADKGWRRAAQENPELALGLNIIGGRVVCKPVADAWGLPYEPLVL